MQCDDSLCIYIAKCTTALLSYRVILLMHEVFVSKNCIFTQQFSCGWFKTTQNLVMTVMVQEKANRWENFLQSE